MTTPNAYDFDPTPSPALPDEATERLSQVSTATLTSVLLKFGLRTPFMRRVHPIVKGRRLIGKAYTLRYIPLREDLDGPALEGRFDNLTNPQRIGIEHVGPGDVMVIDAREEVDAGTIGNILVTRMRVHSTLASSPTGRSATPMASQPSVCLPTARGPIPLRTSPCTIRSMCNDRSHAVACPSSRATHSSAMTMASS